MSVVMRAICVLAAAMVVLGAPSCGTAQRPASDASDAGDTTTLARYGGPWGVEIVEPPRAEGQPALAGQLAVFREKRTARDAFDSLLPGSESNTVEGRELYGKSRLLATPNGPSGDRLFGVPTTNGWICPQFVDPDGEEGDSGPCWSTLRDGVSFSLEGDDKFYRLYGVAADNVRNVDLIVRGAHFHVDMGRNAFVFGAKPLAVCPTDIEKLVVERNDGTTSTIELSKVSSLQGTSGAVLGCR